MSTGENGQGEAPPTFWAAPAIASAGYPVFPISPNGKNPSIEGGFYAFSRDHSEIAAWIEEGRGHHNIAVPTGVLSHVVVIEADTPEMVEWMTQRYGAPTVKTPRGGHWWFRHPRNGKVVSNKVRAGLDRKGDGGYVLAPPSSGRSWTNGIPKLEELPVLPGEFWTKAKGPTPGERTIPDDRKEAAAETIAGHVRKITPNAAAGGRHEHLKHLCGVLLSRGVSFVDAEDILTAAWTKTGDAELIERAGHEIPNTLATTQQALKEGRATGVPKMEEITPGLYAELEELFRWKVSFTVGGKKSGEQEGPADGEEAESKDRRNQADRLIGYALEAVGPLFLDQHGAPHGLINGDPVPLTSRCYAWLRRLMWEEEGRSVSGEYLKMATGTLAAHAEFSGEVRELYTRAAWHAESEALYYELRPGKVVRVDAGGWTFEANPPVLFRRYPNLKPLPDPKPGGPLGEGLDVLDELANLKTDRDRRLFKAYLATFPLEHVGRPILNASGAMGSGKTTIGRIVKRTWDPTAPETVRYDPRDFLQKAMHAFGVMLDNQNTISEAASDTLCRLVTGEADSKRRLYTDDEDVILELRRAVILNGINVPTDRGDVLDRSLVVEMERIPDGERKTEEHLWELFAHEHPRLLGALLDILSKAIAVKPSLKLSRRPRLADWGEYAAAVYAVMGWGAETFLSDWDEVVKAQNQGTLDGSPTAQAIIKMMNSHEEVSLTSSKMHAGLKQIAEEQGVDVNRDKAWPKSARWLWRRIKEVLPLLIAAGIEASRHEDRDGTKITFRKVPKNDATNATPDENPVSKPNTRGNSGKSNATSNATAPESNATGGNSGGISEESNPTRDADTYADSGKCGNSGIRYGANSEGRVPDKSQNVESSASHTMVKTIETTDSPASDELSEAIEKLFEMHPETRKQTPEEIAFDLGLWIGLVPEPTPEEVEAALAFGQEPADLDAIREEARR